MRISCVVYIYTYYRCTAVDYLYIVHSPDESRQSLVIRRASGKEDVSRSEETRWAPSPPFFLRSIGLKAKCARSERVDTLEEEKIYYIYTFVNVSIISTTIYRLAKETKETIRVLMLTRAAARPSSPQLFFCIILVHCVLYAY